MDVVSLPILLVESVEVVDYALLSISPKVADCISILYRRLVHVLLRQGVTK